MKKAIKAIKDAIAKLRTLCIWQYDSESVSIGSTRSITIEDSEDSSQLHTVFFTTYAWEIRKEALDALPKDLPLMKKVIKAIKDVIAKLKALGIWQYISDYWNSKGNANQ